MATEAKNASRTLVLDTTSAQYNIDLLNKKIDSYNATLQKTSITDKQRLDAEKSLAVAIQKRGDVQQQVENGLGATYQQQQRYVADLTREVKGLATGTDAYNTKLTELKKAQGVFVEMQTNIKGVTAANTELGGSFGKILTRIGEYATVYAVFDTVKDFIKDSIAEANKAEAAYSRLNNILTNIGRADVFGRLKDRAEELSAQFGTFKGDEVIEVFQKLITYGKLTETQIKDLTPVIVDFAAKQRISLADAADVMTKALEGNSKALKEYGINVKDGHDVTERFGILMDDLKPRVEGAAQAFGETTAGQIQKTTVEIDNLKEKIGTELQPTVKTFYQMIADGLEGLPVMFESVGNSFKSFGNVIAYNYGIVKNLITGGVGGAGQFMADAQAQADKENEIANNTAAILNSAGFAKRLAEGNANLKLDEQQKLLTSNIAILKSDMDALSTLVNAGKTNSAEANKLRLQIVADNQIIDEFQKSIASQKDNRVLGLGTPGTDTTGDKEFAIKKKQAEDFLNTLKTFNTESGFTGVAKELLDAAVKRMEQLTKLGDDLKKNLITAAEYKQGVSNVEQAYHFNVQAISDKEDEKYKVKIPVEVVPNTDAEQQAELKEAIKKLKENLDVLIQQNLGDLEINVLQAKNPKAKMDAELALLDAQYDVKLRKEVEYQKKKQAIIDEYAKSHLKDYENSVNDLQTLADIAGKFNQAKDNKENAQLSKDLKANDTRKAALQKELNGKLISQQQYDSAVAKIDADSQKRQDQVAKAQFERNKKMQLAQAAIDTARAVGSIWAQWPKWDGGFQMYFAIAAAVASGIAEVSAINGAKYAKGGILEGPSHAQGGIPLRGKGGRYYGEAEGGEVILSRKTVQNNMDFIRPLLETSMFRGGARLQNVWDARPYQAVNYPSVAQSQQRMRFADGGVLQGSVSGNWQQGQDNSPATAQVLQQTMDTNMLLINTIKDLHQQLKQPMHAQVQLTQLQRTQDLQSRIYNSAQFK